MFGDGTANGSAPHVDARDMAFDAAHDLIQVDDGGVYKQTNPADNSGIWLSLNGHARALAVAEMHDCAYDPIVHVIFCGNQDIGITVQSAPGSVEWITTPTAGGAIADGGMVAVGVNATSSVRYWSAQNLGNLTTQVCSPACGARTTAALAGFDRLDLQFVTPIAANAIDWQRFVLGTRGEVWESDNQAATVTKRPLPDLVALVQAMAYGGRDGATPKDDVLWVGSSTRTPTRTRCTCARRRRPATPATSR